MKRVDVVSAIIHNNEGDLLIVKNVNEDSYYWGLPGGAVEDGETLMQAVIREVKEEMGFDIEVTGFNSLREKFFVKPQHHVLFATFFARVVGGELGINDPDNDIAEAKWVDIRTIKELMPFLFDVLQLDSHYDKAKSFYAFEGTQ